MNAPGSPGLGRPIDPGSPQTFPEDGQSVPQRHPAYNSGPQGSQRFQNSGQPPVGSRQSRPHAPPPSTLTGYDSGEAPFIKKGGVGAATEGSGPPPQQPPPANQQQPAGAQQTYQKPSLPKLQPPAGPQQAFQNPVPHAGDTQQQYPPGHQQTYQHSSFKQPDHNPGPGEPYENLGSQHAHKEPQQAYQDSDSQQSRHNLGSQAYPPAGPQQYPPPRGRVAGQISVPDSARPPQPDASAQSLPGQAQSGNAGVYVEGGGPAKGQKVASLGPQDLPKQEQSSVRENFPQSRPNPQKVAPHVANPAQRKHPAATSGSAAGARPQGLQPTDTSPQLIDSQKAYIVPGHSEGQGSPDAVYQPRGKGQPEPPHPHSAYDVRIGEPVIPRRKTTGQKSFLNPTELSDLDAQGPSRYLDSFGDQYLPQQGFGQQQQYNPYSRYPNAYPQSAGNQGSGYQGLPSQLYPGTQGQRVYPQQGYLDLGYPSPQYEFGEFDPPYPEPDNYPGNHDVPAYRPDSKLGYCKHTVCF